MATIANVLSLSGGKDSTAMLLVAMEQQVENLTLVFADTGHEHPDTYRYIDYLDEVVAARGYDPIRRVSADFTERMARKRDFIAKNWPTSLQADRPGKWVESRVLERTRKAYERQYASDGEIDEDGLRVFLAQHGFQYDQPSEPPADPYNKARSHGWEWLPTVPGLSAEEAQARADRAIEVLQPTGIPMLDLCLWKGRFPSTTKRFCTTELKHDPIENQVVLPLMEQYDAVVSWQGVRADESHQRAHLIPKDIEYGQWEPEPQGLLIYRPILDWTADDVFAKHHEHGIEPNPLYRAGMGRVGCMPCIHANKGELYEIDRRFPEEIARVHEWEKLVSDAGKRGSATLYPVRGFERRGAINHQDHGIYDAVRWARTSHGGRVEDLVKVAESRADRGEHIECSSVYGLCE